MYSSKMAEWLDTFFSGYDHFFLNILHVLGDKAGGVLTPLMRAITFIGEKGIVFFLLALIFMLMADRRDLGVCIFGAVCCGALITNIILKDAVGRVRPYEAVAEYNAWWQALGAPAEDGWSFPSGHVTACTAGMTAITLMRGKKWILPSVLIVFIMGVSRNYLLAHYPSDVLFAVLIGIFSGVVAWLITQLIFRFLRRNRRNSPLCAAILDFDIRDVLPLPRSGSAGRRAAKSAAPARPARASRASRAQAAREDFDDDVKTYSSARSQAAPAEEEAPAAPRRSRAGSGHAAAPRRARAAAAEEAPEAAPSPVPAEEEAPAEAPRRVRSGGSHSIPSRASAGSGGRHSLNAGQDDAPRASRGSAKKSRLPGGYQGKHVK